MRRPIPRRLYGNTVCSNKKVAEFQCKACLTKGGGKIQQIMQNLAVGNTDTSQSFCVHSIYDHACSEVHTLL